jgi:ataxia telangiectasia mutated family protein
MYETYSNVEDPDGFYGVKTNNIADALQRRLQHEGEHWRSFGLHGAALESGLLSNQVATVSLSAMQDLHNLGFNHISNAIFQSLRSSSDKATSRSSEPLLFELAWRTSDWDLPVPAETSPSAETLLYSSLRAVHRERDLTAARSEVRTAINKEVDILRMCGMERTTQIKKAVADLLCLHEVQRWLGPEMQAALDGKDPQGHLQRLTTLDSAFP